MQNFRTAKAAAYITNISMSAVATISPLLFSTFYTHYGISYSLLGLLVLVNFCTQLAIDLIFSFYSHKFNLKLTIRIMPVLTAVGFAVYATLPMLFPQAAYWGLVAGTMIFALSGGLAEVLISPLIAAMPFEHPEREMSKLHSVYAWGVVAIVLASSGILYLIGKENWYWLALGLTAIPVVAAGLFFFAPMPEMETPQKTSGAVKLFTDKSLILCILCIFFGGASENIMSQWCSGYLEQALGISKLLGDIFGVAMFAFMLGLGRTIYALCGKSIYRFLIAGACGAIVCYVVAAVTSLPVLGLIACALTGFCTSMLWPGSLIATSDFFPHANVAVFALMAAGGDLGASVGPQLIGLIADAIILNPDAAGLASSLQLTVEQLGMKAGVLFAAIFPVLAAVCFGILYKLSKKKKAVLLNGTESKLQ